MVEENQDPVWVRMSESGVWSPSYHYFDMVSAEHIRKQGYVLLTRLSL